MSISQKRSRNTVFLQVLQVMTVPPCPESSQHACVTLRKTSSSPWLHFPYINPQTQPPHLILLAHEHQFF